MRVILYVYAYRYVARIKSGDFEISRHSKKTPRKISDKHIDKKKEE